ncbi:MAG: heme biosynthesis protein HemY, partial [Leucothrix sp.]
ETEKSKYQAYMQRAVVGLFQITSGKQDLAALEVLWQQLPNSVTRTSYAAEAYASALTNAGGGDLAAPLLEERLDAEAQRALFACYGVIQHRKPNVALAKARAWEVQYGTDSELLLCLARLEQQCGNQAASADYYERALTLVPDQQVYYEFAELLLAMGDTENASRCSRQGLRYCVQGKARPFKRH